MTDGWERDIELADIRWLSDDLYTVLKSKFGREPTDAEMKYYMDNVNWSVLSEPLRMTCTPVPKLVWCMTVWKATIYLITVVLYLMYMRRIKL